MNDERWSVCRGCEDYLPIPSGDFCSENCREWFAAGVAVELEMMSERQELEAE